MLQGKLSSFAKPYFKIHFTGSNILKEKKAGSTKHIHFSAMFNIFLPFNILETKWEN